MNILIVDDEPQLARLMREVLIRDGWAVTIASSLLEAKRLDGPFDVIVADVRLPNGDGRHLKELHPETPFVMVSGFPGEEPDLHKPFSPMELRGAVYAAVPRFDRRGVMRE